MDKQKELNKIASEIKDCVDCKRGKSGKTVPGEGNPNAGVVFIGEAPGKTEALTGRPFVGRSGKLLRSFITGKLGLKEDEVFITSPVKYLPDSGTPTPQDISHGKTHLDQQLKIIDPKIIVLLGRVAVEGVLGLKAAVKKDHGKIIDKDGRKYFITLHPAAAVRFAKNRPIILEDFKKLTQLLQQNTFT